MLALLSAGAWAQTSEAPATTPKKPATTSKKKDKSVTPAPSQQVLTAADVQALKDGLAAQQQQIQHSPSN